MTFHGVGVHPGHGEGQARQPGQARRAVRREPAGGRRSRPRRPRGARGSSTRTRSRAAPTAVTVTLILRDFEWETLRSTRRSCGGSPRRRSRTSRARASRSSAGSSTATCARRSTASARRRGGARGDAARRARADAALDPRRHRRLAADRDGPADAEHLHRRQRVPLGARVDQRAGHGRLCRDGGRAAEALGRARVAARVPAARAGERASTGSTSTPPGPDRRSALLVAPRLFRLRGFAASTGTRLDTIFLRWRSDPAATTWRPHELCHVWQMQHHRRCDAALLRCAGRGDRASLARRAVAAARRAARATCRASRRPRRRRCRRPGSGSRPPSRPRRRGCRR